MKRWTIRILVFLLLGAIVNVAVAWGCGYSPFFSIALADRYLTPVEIERLWTEHACAGSGARLSGVVAADLVATRKYLGERLFMADLDRGVLCFGPDKAFATTLGIVEAGFPCRSMTHNTKREPVWAVQMPPARLSTSVEWLSDCRIIWPGFAINTVFYAAVLWLLFAAPFALRRWRRIRRGLCPKCGYDLRNRPTESAVCPECGEAAKQRSAR
jgi:hypothetical protein